MEINSERNLMKMPFYKQLVLVVGVFCILWGIFLIYLAFNKEPINENSRIGEVTEYIADKPKLSAGEIRVTKTTRYLKNAEYQLIYKNYMDSSNDIEVLSPESGLQIVDVLGNGYSLVEDSIKVNDKAYSSDDKIKIDTRNQMIKIEIPNDLCSTINTIEAKIKLTERNIDTKYFTSQDAYYNFTPNARNKFYEKKTSQSYLIDGNGYIKLITAN